MGSGGLASQHSCSGPTWRISSPIVGHSRSCRLLAADDGVGNRQHQCCRREVERSCHRCSGGVVEVVEDIVDHKERCCCSKDRYFGDRPWC